MSVYLDASVLVPLIVVEVASPSVRAFIGAQAGPLWVSSFAAAEVASAISRMVRMAELDHASGAAALADFDRWSSVRADLAEVINADVLAAGALVRRFELKLRTPDALHIGICDRLGAELVTLDARLSLAANAIGVRSRAPAPK